MDLGKVHYSEDALISIIKNEALSNHPVSSISVKMTEEGDFYVFNLEISFHKKEEIMSHLKKLQSSVVKTIETMTKLANIKVNIHLKSLK